MSGHQEVYILVVHVQGLKNCTHLFLSERGQLDLAEGEGGRVIVLGDIEPPSVRLSLAGEKQVTA